MKIKYDWRSLGLVNSIKALWPSKTKKYLIKWMKTKHLLNEATFYTSFTGKLAVKFDLSANIVGLANPVFIHFADALEEISKFENMRNAYELCIWLDMEDVA